MAEVAKSRDARRRRRILDQGSDRLAFITGRIQTLPPTLPDSAASSTQSPHPNTTLSASDSISHNLQPYGDDNAPNTAIQTPHKNQPERDIVTVPTSEIQPEQVQLQQPPQSPSPSPPYTEEPKRFVTPSDITRAINSSRVTRLCCSVLVALMVLLSFLGTNVFSTVISFRPLYVVLVTNATVVIARLFFGVQRDSGRTRRSGSSGDGEDEYSQLARMLELCLVAKNVADAVFMDCAIYAIVLICGLSLIKA
ncbi:uncharacterized protein LOC124826437 [Vigna umbellata]|uniref:uncharacterized protein LOC124826437 n=1 Tax=Vigna umbellata TaxID=87088 RepID=UPI001F5EA94B|nr:uncharacterized protein LOC124826437 [Vigna umbellata]